MAHKKAAGSAKNLRDSNPKYRGVKVFGGQPVVAGNIIVRQKGNKYEEGENTYLAKDFSIHSSIDGIVTFSKKNKLRFDGRRYLKTVVNVVPFDSAKLVKTTTEEAKKPAAKKAPAKATAAKKPAAKKAPAKVTATKKPAAKKAPAKATAAKKPAAKKAPAKATTEKKAEK